MVCVTSNMKTINLSMIIEAEAITEYARRMFYNGKITDVGKHYGRKTRIIEAYEILGSLIPKPTQEQKEKILKGEAYLKGDSHIGIIYVEEVDWKFKYEKEKQAKDSTLEALRETVTIFKDTVEEMARPTLERAKERREKERKFEQNLKQITTSNAKSTIIIGRHEIQLKTLEEYLLTVRYGERAGALAMAKGDPSIAQKALALRITKHRAIFDEVNIPYYQDDKNKNNKESFEFAEAIEKYIEEKYLDDSKMERAKRMANKGVPFW